LVVPTGSYSGQVVLHVDADNERTAKLIVKTNRTPVQSATIFELPLYNVNVSNGLITDAIDIRTSGGTMPNNHLHPISDITGLQTQLNSTLTWVGQSNGVKCIMGRYNTTGKPVALFLTTTQPSASSTEHRVWIQIDNF
jgi:5,10-methylene-tetrahydrofolate dehydrogenase/methenyl tetrahydrofolate cyclohydrolase